jgi:hypothetical protein
MSAERVEGLGKGDEVAGDEAGALVDELVEAVLAVGAGLAPVDRTRFGIHMGAIEFHIRIALISAALYWLFDAKINFFIVRIFSANTAIKSL